MTLTLAVLKGDAIGPEATDAALEILSAWVALRAEEGLVRGAAIGATGNRNVPWLGRLMRSAS